MLSAEEIRWLGRELAATAEALGQVLSSNAAGLIAADLADYTKPQLKEALRRTRVENRGRLSLSVILEQLDRVVGRYGQEEAWALAVQARQEAITVVWNTEISQAWAVVSPMAAAGDVIGARMAFKEAYQRITQEARQAFRKPEVSVSIGWDSSQRVAAISQAYEQGLLPLEQAKSLLAGDSVELQEGRFVAQGTAGNGPAIAYDRAGRPYKARAATGVLQLLLAGPAQAPPVPTEVALRLKGVATKAKERAPRRKEAMVRLERYKFRKAQERAEQATRNYLMTKEQKKK